MKISVFSQGSVKEEVLLALPFRLIFDIFLYASCPQFSLKSAALVCVVDVVSNITDRIITSGCLFCPLF